MDLRRKVPLAFAFALLLTALAGFGGLWVARTSLRTFQGDVQAHFANERIIGDMEVHFKAQVQEWKDVLLRGMDRALLDKHWKAFQREEALVEADATTLKTRLNDDALLAQLNRFVALHQKMAKGYRDGLDKFESAGMESSVGDLAVRGIDREPARLLQDIKKEIGQRSAQAAGQAFQSGQDAVWISSILMAVSVCAGVGIGLVLSRSVVTPLMRAIEVASDVAGGNLAREIVASGEDETARLLRALADMQGQLRGLVLGVRDSADYVAASSTEIAQGNNNLAMRTEQQASALQTTASSMRDLNLAVERNALHAHEANELARKASGVATSGGEVVGQVIDTMSSIHEASRKVVEIISVIDGIAFQTNILALNAAVEAARAGEQGKGFAVVAGEVRSLAQRAAAAAREIKSLINASVERVEQGSALVNHAGETMKQVVEAIGQVTAVIAAIGHASQEQREQVVQVGEAVHQLDHSTQQNAAMVEETSAAAESLRDRAGHLVKTVGQFRLERQG